MSVQSLQRVWDDIPDLACKGQCVDSCGPIGASPLETLLLAERGVALPDLMSEMLGVLGGKEPCDCPALVNGRCSVYDVRPTVCRLWGVVEEMPCKWGCIPEGGLLATGVGHRLLERATDAGHLQSRRERRSRA